MSGTRLKESLADWPGFPALGPHFEPRLTRAAARGARRLLGDAEPRPPGSYDLKQLHARVAREWNRRESLDRVRPRDLRQLPWVLFYPPRADRQEWLGADRKLVGEYVAWMGNGRRARSVAALLHEFLRVYPTRLPTFQKLRAGLRAALRDEPNLLADSPPPPPSLRKWAARCRDFGLLEADYGRGFAFGLVKSAADVAEQLAAAGFDAGLARCKFLESAARRLLPACSEQLERSDLPDPHVRQLVAFLECEGAMRFDTRSMRRKTAAALLGPFVARRPPSRAAKRLLRSFFLRHFGDPRLPSTKHKWHGAPDQVTAVMRRWLVERVLEQFFLLLKETALDHHWRYREAFWRAFMDRDLIDDIWFVLGRSARSHLKRATSDASIEETTGKLVGAQASQSVLIMRMPGATIAEWSHAGSCHIWLDGAPGAPELGGAAYRAHVLRRPFPYPVEPDAHSQRHHGSASGSWQDLVAEWLRANTGIELDRSLYFPRHLQARTQAPPSPRGWWT